VAGIELSAESPRSTLVSLVQSIDSLSRVVASLGDRAENPSASVFWWPVRPRGRMARAVRRAHLGASSVADGSSGLCAPTFGIDGGAVLSCDALLQLALLGVASTINAAGGLVVARGGRLVGRHGLEGSDGNGARSGAIIRSRIRLRLTRCCLSSLVAAL